MSGQSYVPEDAPLFMANRILDNVFVGSHYAAEDEDFIFTNTISRVINTVSAQVPNRFYSLNVRYLSYHFDASGGSQIFDAKDERITQIVRFINEALEQDSCVLIHSLNGDSRAVVLMAAYLIHRFHWPPHRALQFVATKRSCSKPHAAYVKQLHEFAGRRRAKYGEFKDIFGSVRGLKLNYQEILHRNTFLNAIQAQDPPDLSVSQTSPLDVLIKLGAIQKQLTQQVSFRDGLQTAQISASYANFDANGRPANPSMTSQLFRPRTPSYVSTQQVRCLPVRLDAQLLPAVSFDLDLPPHHTRRPDGYLQPISQECSGFATVARPVSILKRMGAHTREAYEKEAVFVGVGDWEQALRDAMTRQHAAPSYQSSYPANYGSAPTSGPQIYPQQFQSQYQVESYQTQHTISAAPQKPAYSAPVSLNYVNMQIYQEYHAPQYAAQAGYADSAAYEAAYYAQRQAASRTQPNYSKPGQFTKIRPPTPPRKQDVLPTSAPQSQFRFPQAKIYQSRPQISYRPVQNKPTQSMSGYGFNQKVGSAAMQSQPAGIPVQQAVFNQAPLPGRNTMAPQPRNTIAQKPAGTPLGYPSATGYRWK